MNKDVYWIYKLWLASKSVIIKHLTINGNNNIEIRLLDSPPQGYYNPRAMPADLCAILTPKNK